MALPALLKDRLSVPVIGAPMFILSRPELVIAQCAAGVVGSFPALNARPKEKLGEWITQIKTELDAIEQKTGSKPAPFAVNQIVHATNQRMQQDMEVCIEHEVPIIITSLSKPTKIVEQVHAYGGLVFHDVINTTQAKKALEAGVDGLILVCAGAGGHTGSLSPFAFVEEVRRIYDGLIILSGAIATGRSVLAAQAAGADLAYIGTLFIASKEAATGKNHKQMIVDSSAADIVCTDAVTGVRANFLSKSFEAIGVDPKKHEGGNEKKLNLSDGGSEAKAWRDVYGGGQGVGSIDNILGASEWIVRLQSEYQDAVAEMMIKQNR